MTRLTGFYADAGNPFRLECESEQKFGFSTPRLGSGIKRPPTFRSENPSFSLMFADIEKEPEDPNELGPGQIYCNCKNSKCLKLYCNCFKAGQYCNEKCLCLPCRNKPQNDMEREAAIENIKTRNPLAFKPRIEKKENAV